MCSICVSINLMPDIKILAEKYEQVHTTPSAEQLIESITATELLECFNELAKTDEENVLVSFSHAIGARSRGVSMVQESVKYEDDQELKLAILALEKVLTHFDESKDEDYCVMFETFARGKKEIEDEDVNPNGDPADIAGANSTYPLAGLQQKKPGFFSKLGAGIKKYAGKAASAVGKGLAAAPGAIAKGAAATGKYVGQTVGGAAGGLAGGLVGGAKNAYTNARDTAPYGATATGGADKAAPAAATPDAQPAAPAAPAAATPAAPAASDAQAKVGVGQINKIVGTLRARDLESIKKNIEQRLAALAAKRAPKTPIANATTPAPGAVQPAANDANAHPWAGSKGLATEKNVIKEFYISNNKHFRK
jgi:hypothetical protein